MFYIAFASHQVVSHQVASKLLLTLDRLEQRPEIASPKTREIVPLDDLDENGRAIHQVLINRVSIDWWLQLQFDITFVNN